MPKPQKATLTDRDLQRLVSATRIRAAVENSREMRSTLMMLVKREPDLKEEAEKLNEAWELFYGSIRTHVDNVFAHIQRKFPKAPVKTSAAMRRIALARTSSRIYTKAVDKLVGGDLRRAQRKVKASRTKR